VLLKFLVVELCSSWEYCVHQSELGEQLCDTLRRLTEAITELRTVDATHTLVTCPCCFKPNLVGIYFSFITTRTG
jgi:hypothetical protein